MTLAEFERHVESWRARPPIEGCVYLELMMRSANPEGYWIWRDEQAKFYTPAEFDALSENRTRPD